jgi:peptide/nickel transport system substrate-binding protein
MVASLTGVVVLAACSGGSDATPVVIIQEVVKEVEIEKIIEKEVPVIVEKEVVVEVQVEKPVIVEKEVVKEVRVEVEKVVEKTVVVIATAVPVVEKAVAEVDKYGGNLKVVAHASIATLDVGASGAYVTGAIARGHLWEAMFMQGLDYTTQPVLIDTFDLSTDGLTWTFKLRDLVFHDGSPVTSKAAIQSLQRHIGQTAGVVLAGFLAGEPPIYETGFTIVDDRTFTISTIEPYGSILDGFALHSAGQSQIFTETASAFAYGDDFGEENYIGTGAYKFKLWEPGHRIVLERFDRFVSRREAESWFAGEKKAYVDTITWFEIPSEETKVAGLQTGEWDFVDSIGLDFVGTMTDDPDIDITWYPGHMWYFSYNQNEPLVDDINFRLAVQKSMDGEAMLASIGPPETWKLNCSIYGSGTVFETGIGCANHYNQNDINGAKELLAQSSYAGEMVTLMNPTDYSTITPVGFVIKDRLQEIGVNVDMPAMDWATRISRTAGRDSVGWHLATSWGTIRNRQNPAFSFMIAAGGVAFNNYYNAEMDDAHKAFLRTQDFAEQKALADTMQLLFFQDPPQVYSGIFFMPSGYRTWVENVIPEHNGQPSYNNVWISR